MGLGVSGLVGWCFSIILMAYRADLGLVEVLFLWAYLVDVLIYWVVESDLTNCWGSDDVYFATRCFELLMYLKKWNNSLEFCYHFYISNFKNCKRFQGCWLLLIMQCTGSGFNNKIIHKMKSENCGLIFSQIWAGILVLVDKIINC